MKLWHIRLFLFAAYLIARPVCVYSDENWLQFKYDCRHSGNAPERSLNTPLGLVGAVPLTDAIFTAPVVAGGRIYVVDGAGVAFCLDAATLRVDWKFPSGGGKANCNNVSSPAIAEGYLHFGTMAGSNMDIYDLSDVDNVKLVSSGPRLDPSECVGSVISNGRVFYTCHGGGLQACQVCGTETASIGSPWQNMTYEEAAR